MKEDRAMATRENDKVKQIEEIELKAMSGMACMVMNILAILACTAAFVLGIIWTESVPYGGSAPAAAIVMIVVSALYGFGVGPVLFIGLKIIKPNEAMVLTLFGKYIGTLKGAGFYWVNPFCISVNPAAGLTTATSTSVKA